MIKPSKENLEEEVKDSPESKKKDVRIYESRNEDYMSQFERKENDYDTESKVYSGE